MPGFLLTNGLSILIRAGSNDQRSDVIIILESLGKWLQN